MSFSLCHPHALILYPQSSYHHQEYENCESRSLVHFFLEFWSSFFLSFFFIPHFAKSRPAASADLQVNYGSAEARRSGRSLFDFLANQPKVGASGIPLPSSAGFLYWRAHIRRRRQPTNSHSCFLWLRLWPSSCFLLCPLAVTN